MFISQSITDKLKGSTTKRQLRYANAIIFGNAFYDRRHPENYDESMTFQANDYLAAIIQILNRAAEDETPDQVLEAVELPIATIFFKAENDGHDLIPEIELRAQNLSDSKPILSETEENDLIRLQEIIELIRTLNPRSEQIEALA